MISLLNSGAGEDRLAALFSRWINTPQTPTSVQERKAIEAYDNAMNEMIVRIFGLLTPAKKDHLRKKIAAYIDDIQQLHSATDVDTANAHHESISLSNFR